MRKITDFLIDCTFVILCAICFVIAFIDNSILFIPFAFIVIILAIVMGLFCLPLAIVILSIWGLFWLLMMIARYIVDVCGFVKKCFKS